MGNYFISLLKKWKTSYGKSDLGWDTKNTLRLFQKMQKYKIFGPCNSYEDTINEAFDCSTSSIISVLFQDIKSKLDFSLKYTESPIERLMMLSLITYAVNDLCDIDIFDNKYNSWFDFYRSIPCEYRTVKIKPQAVLGEFKVDFLIEYDQTSADDKNELISESSKLIVECDGHDFHDRTSEQAKKDRQRDRWLQRMGYPVYRFTGSEINKDVFECTDHIFEHLSKHAKT